MSENNERDNRSKQLNPNNDAYWQARGYAKRPRNWKALVAKSKGFDVKTTRRRKKGGRGLPFEWDDFGLLPGDGLGRLSSEDY